MNRRRWRRSQPRATDLVYVAVRPECGCVVDAIAAQQMARARLKREIEEWFARGLWIGRLRAREAAHRITACAHEPPAPDGAQLELV